METQRRLLRGSIRELEQLAELVEGLLRWSVEERLERRRVDLVRVVDEAVASCRMEIGEERVSVTAPPRLEVDADPVHVRGAIVNVVRNALVYSPPSSTVSVEVREERGQATVAVKDRGPGIGASEEEAIFQPFVRGAAASRWHLGSGLGLFIARRVVEAHGGSIRVEGAEEGTTVMVRLPVGGGTGAGG